MTGRRPRVRLLLALLAVGPGGAGAQSPAPSAAPSPAPSPCTAADYTVGPGDVLEVTVFGNDDLSRTPTVQTSGVIALPLLGEVPVAGLPVGDIQKKVTTLLGKDYLVNPQVEVKVKEYHSRHVSLVGEVNSPGRKSLKGCTRLIDVLIEAGGFNSRASGEVIITRRDGTFEDGTTIMQVRLSGAAPTLQEQRKLETPLRDGDLITASPKYYVTVEGEVARPGRYPIEGELTVSGAISLAGGLGRFGSSDLKVRRVDPETGQTQIIEVDLKDIRNGKKPDVVLKANDVVSVSRRVF
jgi:polysaccharide export outer membrane protein